MIIYQKKTIQTPLIVWSSYTCCIYMNINGKPNQNIVLDLCEDSWPYNSDYSRVEWNIVCPVIYHGSDLVCCHADVQAAAGRVRVHDHCGRTPRKHHLFLCPGCILLSVVLSPLFDHTI